MNIRICGNKGRSAIGAYLCLAGSAAAGTATIGSMAHVTLPYAATGAGLVPCLLVVGGLIAIAALVWRQRSRAARINADLLKAYTYALVTPEVTR